MSTAAGGRAGLAESARLVLTLAVAGLFSGLAIVGAYELTLPRIRANQAAALRAAVFEVLPGADRMQRLAWDGSALAPATGDGPDAAAEPSVYAGYDPAGALVGYAVPAAGAGYQDTISLLYGLAPGGDRVIGMRVLESRETPGLGDRIFKDQAFVGAFRDLSVEPRVELVKDGADAANEVDAITGATISSTAVVAIVNAGNEQWRQRLPPPGEAPPPPAADRPVAPGREPGRPVPGGRLGEAPAAEGGR